MFNWSLMTFSSTTERQYFPVWPENNGGNTNKSEGWESSTYDCWFMPVLHESWGKTDASCNTSTELMQNGPDTFVIFTSISYICSYQSMFWFFSWTKKLQQRIQFFCLPTQRRTGCWPNCFSKVQICWNVRLSITSWSLTFCQKSLLLRLCAASQPFIPCTRWLLKIWESNEISVVLLLILKWCFLQTCSCWFHTFDSRCT